VVISISYWILTLKVNNNDMIEETESLRKIKDLKIAIIGIGDIAPSSALIASALHSIKDNIVLIDSKAMKTSSDFSLDDFLSDRSSKVNILPIDIHKGRKKKKKKRNN